MANRCYLYVFDRFENGMPQSPRGLHHWTSSIPIAHLLMMSGKPRTYSSSLFVGPRSSQPAKVAIVADYEAGAKRLLTFSQALETSGALPAKFAAEVRGLEASLAEPAAQGRFALLEPCEIFWLGKALAEVQCAKVVDKQIPALTAQVDALLGNPPGTLFSNAPKWLANLRKNPQDFGLSEWGSILPMRIDAATRQRQA